MNISPVLIAAVVTITIALVGAFVFALRQRRTFSGYGNVAEEVKNLASQLEGELFRDGSDLVISGDHKGMPVLVRFSNEENSPGVRLEVRVPTALHLSIKPKQINDDRIGSKVKLSPWLEQRFLGRSKSGGETELFLSQRRTFNILTRLCVSTRTVLEISPGKIEVLELVIPDAPCQKVIDHLNAIVDLDQVLKTMPGADEIKIVTIPRERSSWGFRATVAAGVVIAAVTVMAAMHERPQPVLAAQPTGDINGMVRADATLIPLAEQWHVADKGETDPGFAEFVTGAGLQPNAHIEFDPDGNGRNSGVAYLLANKDGAKRIVILEDHRVVFDTCLPSIAGIARVPASSFAKLQTGTTRNGTQQNPGDGILLVRNSEDPHSGMVLYLHGTTVQSASLSDFHSVSLEQVASGY